MQKRQRLLYENGITKAVELSANYKQTVFVPTFDLFQLKVDDYLYTDKFHPNAKGYKLIAERVASLITW